MNKQLLIIGIIISVILIPIAIYTISPLFINTTVNEEDPRITNSNKDMIQEFEKFMSMSEDERIQKGQQMSNDEKNAVMIGAAQTPGMTVNEKMTLTTIADIQTPFAGAFVGVNDGIHNAEGQAKVISLDNNTKILRLENFKSTNGPDLYVYLATDKTASDFISLGRLKGNIGNQNYNIPEGTDLSRYNTVLIWCRAFSVLFGSAELKPQ